MPDAEADGAHIYCGCGERATGRRLGLAEALSYLYSKCAFYMGNRWAKCKEVVC